MSDNIELIYSKTLPQNHPQALLHMIIRKDAFNEVANRRDMLEARNFLQLALLKLHKDQTFKAHKHIYSEFYTSQKIANESWEVIKGSVEVEYYDIDNSKLDTKILTEGDLTITIGPGGHNYTALEDNTLCREWKSGPYFKDKDKEFI